MRGSRFAGFFAGLECRSDCIDTGRSSIQCPLAIQSSLKIILVSRIVFASPVKKGSTIGTVLCAAAGEKEQTADRAEVNLLFEKCGSHSLILWQRP